MDSQNKTQRSSSTPGDAVSYRIHEMIRAGELNFGDRLPPERDLAKKLGVSRPTLRVGIRSLAALGMLESRQGSGTFVIKNRESPALNSRQLQMLSILYNFSSDEMFEARID